MADELPPPPAAHVLRPHHVDLLTIIVLAFKEFESRPLPAPFLLHVFRVLLNEMRRSILGYFCRRCFASFMKLSYSGIVKLQRDYLSWCNGDQRAGYENIMRDQLDTDLFMFKTHGDHKTWAQPDSFEAWEIGQATGDENLASENLRRFFEQHFHENNDSQVFHYVFICSMLHRLPPAEGQKPPLNEIQPNLEPLEVLFDVKKLMDERNEQPLSAAFSKIIQAIGLYDYSVDTYPNARRHVQQWAQHAVQAIVWDAAGCHQLSEIEQNIVLAFTGIGGDDNTRITTILNQAYKIARQGEYERSLAIILEPDVWRGLTLDDYVAWAQEVWHILVLRATRRYAGLSAHAIEQLLTALWHSEFLFRLPLYRTAIILLADVGLEFGMSKRCRRILEEIMPQVIIIGGDREQRALACFTLARCIVATEGSMGRFNSSVLNAKKTCSPAEALRYLAIAEADFGQLEMHRPLMDVQYLVSVMYNTLEMEEERDAAAQLVESRVSFELSTLNNRMDDGPPPQEEDFSVIPIAERLTHKNWKARVSAYETLSQSFAKTASETDPVFKPYLNNPDLLKRIATDSNAVAQEKGVECLVALVKYAGETAAKTRETVVPALVDKCFGSARAGTKAQSLELSLQYVEMENTGAAVVTDIIAGLGAKQPKAVAGCVTVLKEIIRLFGTQTTPPAPILKALPKIFGHTDKVVRAEGTLLAHFLYQYIGPAIDPWLADLKPVQVKELKEAFESLEKEGKGKGSLKQERLTRNQAREAEASLAQGDDAAGDEPADDLDPRQSAEPVDIIPKLPASLHTLMTSSKWKERKEVLDDLLTLLSGTPRIKEAPEFGELSKQLAIRIQSDANVNCVMVAAGCMEGLAKGLMAPFARYRETVVPLMLERLKERKPAVTDTIGAALDAVFMTTTLSDIIQDLSAALTSKNPQVKEGTLKFLGRCLANARSPLLPAQIKPLSDSLSPLLEDPFEGARNEAAVCFGTLMKMVGERPLNPVMEGLADVRKVKIKEAYEKATVKCKAGNAPPKAAPPPPAAVPAPKKKAPAPKVVEDAPKPAAKPLARKPPATTSSAPSATAKKPATGASKAPAKSAAPVASGSLDTFKYKHMPEDAEALAVELLPSSIMTDFADANWKTRLAALEEMTPWLEGLSYQVDAEVVIRAFAKKGWTDKNFQVSAKLYGILSALAEHCPSFGRSCVALCVAHLSEKLGDLKLKKPAGDTLLMFAEKTSLQFVLNQAYEPLAKQKAPKVLADAITWVNSAIIDFGIAGISLRALIEFLKSGLQNSNAAVRTSATKTLVTVKLFAGSSIKDLLQDLNPQLLNTISADFDKVEGNAPPEPTRTCADIADIPAATSGQSVGSGGDALDDLFPRVEIDGLLKGTTILADAKSEAWKTKKEALEAFQAILDQGSNKRLKPNMGEIAQVLKARVTDTNKTVQTLALDIVARLATGMGKPFEKQNRFFVLPVATVLADQKAPIRNSALQTLTAIATSCDGLESMVPGLATGLETSNPLQKSMLLNWIVDWFKENEPPASLDLSTWASSVVSCLDDRNADVRKGSQALLPYLITCAGIDYVMQQVNGLKPASRTTAVPIIQAARAQAAPPPAAKAQTVKSDPKPVQSSVRPTPTPPESPTVASAPAPQAPKLTGVRRKLPLGSNRPESRSETPVETAPARSSKLNAGLRRGAATPTASKPNSGQVTPSQSLIFIGTNMDARKARLGKDSTKWINEGGTTRKDLAEALQSQMEHHATKELVARLFSHDHNAVNDHLSGLTLIHDLYVSALDGDETTVATCLANFDLPLKYASIKGHEPQPSLISKCLDVVEAVIAFLRTVNYHLTDNEAICFVPTVVHKLGDAREPVRVRVQQIIQSLSKVYAYSRVFQLLLDHGLKSKVAKTRQGTLDEMAGLLKRSGMGACEPAKAFPIVASLISDKDSQVRKSALGALSEGYALVGEKVWTYVGPLSPKDKTQLEERLRRVTGPSSAEPEPLAPPQVTRLAAGIPRPASPATSARIGGLPRPGSPSVANSRLARASSPVRPASANSPSSLRPASPSHLPRPQGIPTPTSPTFSSAPSGIGRPKSMLPSRLGRPRSVLQPSANANAAGSGIAHRTNGHVPTPSVESTHNIPEVPEVREDGTEDITIIISTILSSDPVRSVEALKKIQKILAIGPDAGPSSSQYRELAEHTEGLIETITLQVAHIFERPDDLVPEENFRLAKHLIQTLNTFCDHAFLAESLTVDILTSLLEELTLRLLETDDSTIKKVKDLSRFINMILLRLFATGRRMSIFRALFVLLLQIVKPFPSSGTLDDSKESKVAELVLKCVWKLVRNIPQDLAEQKLDPVELFPALEHFLQSVPPNEWRARATNKVPCGDMPLRTVKVIIQHVVAHYGDDVYDLLSAAFDDPSATIVYPYVYRILNASTRAAQEAAFNHNATVPSPSSSRPISPQGTVSSVHPASPKQQRKSSPPPVSTPSIPNGVKPSPVEESDPEVQLLTIINHISSETTGALHKEGITQLHHFLKMYPHKKPRVEKLLESTGAAFRKYINRALASRAAEDQERDVAVADTLSKLESNRREAAAVAEPGSLPNSPRSARRFTPDQTETQEKLSRLHDLFQYRSSTTSIESSQPRTSLS
ncbi:hypothetical protein C8J56DRAFT_791650 [Mycena floridula]|nr:hypothetical protein C8J56DRAFT_791650 [Mycena floridula]